MKALLPTFALVFLVHSLSAQSGCLFTLADMEQLANCPDHACFRKAVLARGYKFNKTENSTGSVQPFVTHSYSILSTGTQPYYPQHIVTYVDRGGAGQSSFFLTKSPAYPTQLDNDIEQMGYVLTGSNEPDQDREYKKEADGRVWTLYRSKPGSARGTVTYTIGLSSIPASEKPTVAVTKTRIPSAELPHLGGDWDANYPIRNAVDLLRAERQYAATYDREHGKQGHTFSRADKVRIQGQRTGQYRPLTDKRWTDSFDMALRTTGFDAFANGRRQLYQQEALFEVGGERIWVPVQERIIKTLEKESRAGESITLYAVLVSHHDFGDTLHLSFLVNEFAAPATTDNFNSSGNGMNSKPK